MSFVPPPRKPVHPSETKISLISFYANAKTFAANSSDSSTSHPFPSSHHVLSRFYKLRQDLLPRPLYLSPYLSAITTSHGQKIISQSVTGDCLQERLASRGPIKSLDTIRSIANQLLFAIEHLHQGLGVIIGNLKTENIFIDKHDNVEIVSYGLYTITGHGSDVSFTFPELDEYLSPEAVLTQSSDIWALGIVLLKMWKGVLKLDTQPMIGGVLTHILDQESDMHIDFKSFLSNCLEKDHLSRASIPSLYNHSFMANVEKPNTWFKRPFIPPTDKAIHSIETFYPTTDELYHLWTLFGGDIKREVPEFSTKQPPILCIPTWVPISNTNVEELVLKMQDRPNVLASRKLVSYDTVLGAIERLRHSLDMCQVALGHYNDAWKYSLNFEQTHIEELWEQYQAKYPSQLNSKLKERDMEYQFLRLFRFNSLLAPYPLSEDQIKLEAVADIPPFLRGQIWGAILGVKGDAELFYDEFNNDKPCETDRQLDLDIPRCHQYNKYLSTPVGHAKLKRLLRAWIKSEEGKQVYWQGMDSLAACFVTLNFSNEALAFVSLKSFIEKFCKGFFVLDNSKVMREHMLTFRYLISFHDPELSHHLHSIGLGPEFYGISWFMTLFAHVFPLEKIYLLWDHFLTGAEFFFMYTALSILNQLREQLLTSDFTNAMLIFADLGNVNVEICIIDSIRYSKITPPSIFTFLRQAILVSSEPNAPDNNRFSFLSTKTSILPSISFEDYFTLQSQALVLDARSLDVAMNSGHIPNSIVICLDGFRAKDSFSQGLQILLERKHFTVIITSEDKCELGMLLLKLKQPRLCLLDPILFPEEEDSLCLCKPTLFGNVFQYKCMAPRLH